MPFVPLDLALVEPIAIFEDFDDGLRRGLHDYEADVKIIIMIMKVRTNAIK